MDKQSPNQSVRDYLDYYCQLESPDYAVLLNGLWGCGKTHFIKHYIDKMESSKNFIYVSLYGLTDIAQIEEAFFTQLHPEMKKPGMDIARSALKSVLKNKLGVDFDLATLPGFLCNLENHILVFDDLERCEMPVKQILGYINTFVEGSGRHVIILADEQKIAEVSVYQEIKEKLIGQSFKIEADIFSALEFFSTHLTNDQVRVFILNQKCVINEFFGNSTYSNLRVLNKIILDFERIYQWLPDAAKSKDDLLIHILKLLMILIFETRCGSLTSNDIGVLYGDHFSFLFSKEDNPHKDIYKKYNAYLLSPPVPDGEAWRKFAETGQFDKDTLEEGVQNSSFFADKNQPAWVRLWHWKDVEDDEFEENIKVVLDGMENKEYQSVGVLKHTFGLFHWFSTNGLYEVSADNTVNKFKDYVSSLVSEGLLEEDEGDHDTAFAGLGYWGNDSEEFLSFSRYIESEFDRQIMESLPKQAMTLLDELENDLGSFCSHIRHGESGEAKFAELPILAHIKPSEFVQGITKHGNIFLSSTIPSALENRYESPFHNKKLLPEESWLNEVKSEIEKEIKKRPCKPSGILLKWLVDRIDKSINKLQIAAKPDE